MVEKEIALINKQLESLTAKNFDLEAWKSHTVIFLERIFGKESSKVRMIKELNYNYSSWSLRDAAGTGKDADPVILKAREILEATKLELEHLGVPKQEEENSKIWSLLEEEMTGKQIKEIKLVLQSDEPEKMEKIANMIYNLEKENMAVVLAKLLIP
ncbi:MAG: hypothetical protein A2066_17640 [Bacteroidetes bacterium GWB2_41_8]|nr:MAG: hypothetical protein A2066_17640 [Bacteroidetes bacterium GWB2_41_8]